MTASHSKLEKICEKNPTSILFARLADNFLQKGNLKRALEVCKRGLRYRPSYVAGHLVMGKCYFASERLEEARQEFQKVLQLDPDNVSAFWHLGTIEQEMGWEDTALNHFRKAFALDPFNQELFVRLNETKDPAPLVETSSDLDLTSVANTSSGFPVEYVAEKFVIEDEQVDSEGMETQVAHLVPDLGASQQKETETSTIENHVTEDIATSTLAELYVSQGLLKKGMEILEKVWKREPGNAGVKMRLEELRSSTEDSN